MVSLTWKLDVTRIHVRLNSSYSRTSDSSSEEEKDSHDSTSASEDEETKSNPADDDAPDFSLSGLLAKKNASTHSPGPNPHPSPKVQCLSLEFSVAYG